MTTPIRVRVWSGDNTWDLGLGTLIGYTTLYFAQMPGGTLALMPDPETRPTRAAVAAISPRNPMVVEWPGNPKIRLDSGQIVYGCLVQWSPWPDVDHSSSSEAPPTARAAPML